MANSIFLKFDNLERPVQFTDCEELISCFPVIFRGWEISELPQNDQSPVVKVLRNGNGDYEITADWLDKKVVCREEVDALCTLVARVVKARTMEDLDLLCLHGAAVEIGGALVIFPNKYRAGKSVLTACLAAAGYRVYCDDVLPISLDTGKGLAPGLAPRLRFPYPDNLEDGTREFIESRIALRGKRYHYLDLRNDELASRNSTASIGAFVFLDRAEAAKTELTTISEAEVLKRVVWQNFAREVDAPSILNRLGQIVSHAQSFVLSFDRADDAVELLAKKFQRQDLPDLKAGEREILVQSANPVLTDIPAGYLMRKHGISEVTTDGNAFLADASGAAIHHLNPTGSAIWNLLSQPVTIEQIIELLLVAFPDAGKEQVEGDVRKLIKSLKANNLLLVGPRSVGIRGSG
jgi:hypothetical protein